MQLLRQQPGLPLGGQGKLAELVGHPSMKYTSAAPAWRCASGNNTRQPLAMLTGMRTHVAASKDSHINGIISSNTSKELQVATPGWEAIVTQHTAKVEEYKVMKSWNNESIYTYIPLLLASVTLDSFGLPHAAGDALPTSFDLLQAGVLLGWVCFAVRAMSMRAASQSTDQNKRAVSVYKAGVSGISELEAEMKIMEQKLRLTRNLNGAALAFAALYSIQYSRVLLVDFNHPPCETVLQLLAAQQMACAVVFYFLLRHFFFSFVNAWKNRHWEAQSKPQ